MISQPKNIYQLPPTDVTQFKNWVLVYSGTATTAGTLADVNIPVLNGERYQIVLTSSSTSAANGLLRFNSDSGANYKTETHFAGTAHNYALGSPTSLPLGYGARESSSIAEVFIKSYTDVLYTKGGQGVSADSYIESMAGHWNVATIPNTMNLVLSSMAYYTINVYKWQDFISTDISSYELVKEYTLSNATLNDTLSWDGELYPDLYIKSNYSSGSGTNIVLTLNGDTTNYTYSYMMVASSTTTAGGFGNTTGLFVCDGGVANTSEFIVNLSKGKKRQSIATVLKENPIDTPKAELLCSTWTDKTSAVTSINIFSNVAFTGTVRLYRFIKTALISTNPNLNTTSLKYVDSNTITVNPGEIEINGTICNVSRATNVTLSGNLESGYTESANTYYYLYAIKGSGRTCMYMFSPTAPLMDRYENVVTSFADCDMRKAWFHPTKGLNYRYIGQVHNNASSNIDSFDKCYPGYWEGSWTSFNWTTSGVQTLSHGCGKIGIKPMILFKYSNSDTAFYNAGYSYSPTTSYHGILDSWATNIYPTTSTYPIWAYGENGIYFHSGAWQKAGYYKIIVED